MSRKVWFVMRAPVRLMNSMPAFETKRSALETARAWAEYYGGEIVVFGVLRALLAGRKRRCAP